MKRISLSYQLKPGFPRALIYLGASLLFALAFWLTLPTEFEMSGNARIEKTTWFHLLCGAGMGIAFIFALTDAFFVKGVQSFTPKFEYDDDNLYRIHDDRETVIPLMNITELKMAFGISNSSRGTRYNYIIRYTDDGYNRETEIPVYTQTRGLFDRFKTYLNKKNPDVRISNFATSADAVIRLFKKK